MVTPGGRSTSMVTAAMDLLPQAPPLPGAPMPLSGRHPPVRVAQPTGQETPKIADFAPITGRAIPTATPRGHGRRNIRPEHRAAPKGPSNLRWGLLGPFPFQVRISAPA